MKRLRIEYGRKSERVLTAKHSLLLDEEMEAALANLRDRARAEAGHPVSVNDVLRALVQYALAQVTQNTKFEVAPV